MPAKVYKLFLHVSDASITTAAPSEVSLQAEEANAQKKRLQSDEISMNQKLKTSQM